MTFARACDHITNFTAAHESRARILGDAHFTYPENHIEIDNRLSWFLGRLDSLYGKEARYVHLLRDQKDVAASYAKRYGSGIMRGYAKGIMMGAHPRQSAMKLAVDYCKTVNSNIELFLRDKPHTMVVHLENAGADFSQFWHWIGAVGDLDAALGEWSVSHNSSRRRSLFFFRK